MSDERVDKLKGSETLPSDPPNNTDQGASFRALEADAPVPAPTPAPAPSDPPNNT